MASSPVFFFISSFFLLFLTVIASESTSTVVCPTANCSSDGPEIRLPFRIREAQPEQCGCKGFEVSCDGRNRTILHLAEAGDFVVDSIDYADQYILLKDPDDCLPPRLLADEYNVTSSFSPFVASDFNDKVLMIAQCFFMNSSEIKPGIGLARLACLDHVPHMAFFLVTDLHAAQSWLLRHGCQWPTIAVPWRWGHPTNASQSFWLRWFKPDCTLCEAACGLNNPKPESEPSIGKHGLSKTARFAIAALFTLPWLACIFGFMWFLKVRVFARRGLDQIGSSWVPGPAPLNAVHREDVGAARRNAVGVMGISSPTIESYPKARIEDLGQLPRPNNDVCAICLSKYEQHEMIRTIPECEHYFHACCIDQWLRKNASCPLCRNYKVDIRTEATSNP